jgi:hypothetical protein
MSISSNPAENKPFKLFTIYLKTVLFIAAESSYLRITKPPKSAKLFWARSGQKSSQTSTNFHHHLPETQGISTFEQLRNS